MKSPIAGPVAKISIVAALLTILPNTVPQIASGMGFGGFLRNDGQADDRVQFYGSIPGAGVYFTTEAVVLDLKAERIAEPGPRGANATSELEEHRRGHSVWLRFEGANPAALAEGRAVLPGKANFFLGRDPQTWQTHVPMFAEIVYSNLWPGIDLAFRMREGRLEYEAALQPGADPSRIVFRYDGADRVVRESADTSRLETPLGALWDMRTTETQGAILPASPPRPDAPRTSENPDLLEWCTYLGGSALDSGNAIALDDASRPVVAGSTSSADFPATPGAYQDSLATSAVQYDAFIAKLDSSGTSLQWCTYLGGQGWDMAWALALDPLGAPIVAGDTYSFDFPTTSGCFDPTKNGATSNADVFVTKLDSSGGTLDWSTYLGAGKDEYPQALVLDAIGNVVLGGATKSGAFPTTPGAFDDDHSNPFVWAGFVTKMSSNGSVLVWSTVMEGSAHDQVYGLTLDALGNVSVCGETNSSNFPVLAGAYDALHNGGTDAFVATLSAAGDTLLAGTFLGAPGMDAALSVVAGPSGNIVVGGWTDDGAFPTTGAAYDATHNGQDDVFVAALTADLGSLVWSTFLGGSGNDSWPVLLLDGGHCPVLGYTTDSDDLPMPLDGAFDTSYNGNEDPAIAHLSSDGSRLLWNTYFGGSGGEHFQLNGLALDCDAGDVCAGWTGSDNISAPGAYDETFNGAEDALIYKMQPPIGTDVPVQVTHYGTGLQAARPSPFRHRTSIQYDLPQDSPVNLSVYDASGRLVRRLVNGWRPAGIHRLDWDGRDAVGSSVATGVYFYRLDTGAVVESRKAIVLR